MIEIYVPDLEPVPASVNRVIEDPDDIDYIAVIPPKWDEEVISILECEHFGCCHIEHYPMGDGRIVVVGHHS